MSTPKKKPDFNVIQNEYVQGTDTYEYLAAKYGIKPVTLRARAAAGKWKEAREDFKRNLAVESSKRTIVSRVSQLKEWNDDDLKLAKAVRGRAAMRLAKVTEDSPNGLEVLRTISGVLESAQRIARLALGATTANQGVSNPDGTPINPPSLADLYNTLNFVEADSSEAPPNGNSSH